MKIYSKVGTNAEVIDLKAKSSAPAGYIEMQGQRPGMGYIAQADGTWTESVTELEQARADKLSEINAECDELLKAAVFAYPQSEIQSFAQQLAEAKAFINDSSADVPLLKRIAIVRGIALDELADRVIEKAAWATEVMGEVIGQRQVFTDRLAACTAVEEVLALQVDIALPASALAKE